MRSFWRKSPRDGTLTEVALSEDMPSKAGVAAPRFARLGEDAADALAFGWKAAALHRLIAAGATAPSGFMLDPASISRMTRSPRATWPAVLKSALIAGLEALRADGADSVILRFSPDAPVSDLAPPPVIQLGVRKIGAEILDELARALGSMMEIWSSPRARRRRLASNASDHCPVLVQRHLDIVFRATKVRLYDLETGKPAPSGLLGQDGEKSRRLKPGAGPTDDAALKLAAEAEQAIGGPLEIEVGFLEGGVAVVLRAQPLRAATAALLRILTEMAQDGRLDREDALLALDPKSLEQLLHATVDRSAERDVILRGLAASPGAATGLLAFTAETAETMARDGEQAILARVETAPEDVHGVHAAAGVLTTRGGLTSHAAVVARGLGRPCVVGAAEARINVEAKTMRAPDGRVFHEGDAVTLDGSSGTVLAGAAALRRPDMTGAFAEFMSWADAARRLAVRANADTPADAEIAGRLGAEGVGLCRTEHMFFDPERITAMQEMILADDETERREALARLRPMQRQDFIRLFSIVDHTFRERLTQADEIAPPVTIRLLDPPLHEFLPQDDRGVESLAIAMRLEPNQVRARARELQEFNPILGKRGCRLGVAFPEIYEMQARAIFEAAIEVERQTGRAPRLQIMIALVSAAREFEMLKQKIDHIADAIAAEHDTTLRYGVGVMIETPRAALRAGPLAQKSAFFSFGTNDLTQMTYGLSRDDAGRLMRDYVERDVFEADPFQQLDQEGVGELILIAVERGRAVNPDIEIGLCGEHGADPQTIAFCDAAGFDFISCSPYRAPIARLAAAQAAIRARRRSDPT